MAGQNQIRIAFCTAVAGIGCLHIWWYLVNAIGYSRKNDVIPAVRLKMFVCVLFIPQPTYILMEEQSYFFKHKSCILMNILKLQRA